jgi:iron complex outermembrane recepter protein
MRSRANGRLALVAACSMLAMALAHPAAAQAVAPTVGEVIVTAQKKSENLQNVPEAVTVLSGQFVDQFHATDLADLGAYVPGLQVTSGGTPGQTTLSLRGIYPQATNATVGTYVDDIPVGGSSLYGNTNSFALDLLPYDMSNIEVLSGPQGTLYGASTLGGLLKYELTQPNLHAFHESVGADILGVENAGTIGGGVRASINGPIIEDKLAFMASYAYENTPGYINDVQTGTKGDNEISQQGARLGLLWTPNDKLRVELNAIYQRVDADGLDDVALDPTTLRPVTGELQDNSYVQQPFHKDITLLSDRTSYDFGFADLTSVTSYEYSGLKQVTDTTRVFGPLVTAVGGPDPTLAPEDQYIKLQKYTEEVRLASKPSTSFEWLIGAYITYERTSLFQIVPLENANGTLITPFSAPALGATVYSPLAVLSIPSIYREYAGFGDVTLHLTPQLDLQGGVRYSYNSQNFGQVTGGSLEEPENATGHSSAGVFTFSASPSYKITPDVNAYIRIASGYQPGGPNVALPGVPPTVAADTLTNYEVGLKTQFFDRRGTFNIAAFYDTWNNIQVTALSAANISYVANGGQAKSEGVEAITSVIPIPGLTIGGTFDYTYAVFTNTVPSIGAQDGSPLPQTPRYSGSIQASFKHALIGDWTYEVGGGVRLQGSRFFAVNYSTLFYREPAYGALDFNASVQNDRYTVRLFVKNVTDARTYDSYGASLSALTGTPPEVSGILIQPRTVGLAVDAKF